MDNATDNPNAKRKKRLPVLWVAILCMAMLSLFLSICTAILAILLFFVRSQPLETIPSQPLETIPFAGKVIILNEKGMLIPHQPTIVTFFSHYPPDGVARPSDLRKKDFPVGESGEFNGVIPKFPATFFAHTDDGKYAAIVQVEPELSPIELTIELRPRYSAIGRLVDRDTNNPVAKRKFTLSCNQKSDFGARFPLGRKYALVETFHSVDLETDSTGLFTVDHLIPGAEYSIIIHNQPETRFPAYLAGSLNVPFLSEKEYAQSYSLGDISIPPAPEPAPAIDMKRL